MATYILFNPHAQNGKGEAGAKALGAKLAGEELIFCDMTTLASYTEFFAGLADTDKVILCGGDGTINRFASEAEPSVLATSVM